VLAEKARQFDQSSISVCFREPNPSRFNPTSNALVQVQNTPETLSKPQNASYLSLWKHLPLRVHVTASRKSYHHAVALLSNPLAIPNANPPTMSLIRRARDITCNPSHTQWLLPLLLAADAALCGLIIDRVPCSSSPVEYPWVHRTSTCSLMPIPRHRDRLVDVYAADFHLSPRGT